MGQSRKRARGAGQGKAGPKGAKGRGGSQRRAEEGGPGAAEPAGAGPGPSAGGVVTRPPEPPLVVQCAGCKAILGDTTSTFKALHYGMRTVTLRGAVGVKVAGGDERRAGRGPDAGSAFRELSCVGCGKLVGKIYTATPAGLDPLRDGFTFSPDAVDTFQLGTCDLLLGDDPSGPAAAGPAADPDLARKYAELEEQMLKVENLMLLYNERLEKLEARA